MATERWEGFDYNSRGRPMGLHTWDTFEGPLAVGQLHRPGGGWLSPEGRFYRCPDWTHHAVARRLIRDMGVTLTGEDEEEPAGWLSDHLGWERIWDDGRAIGRFVGDLTQAQMNVMFDLAERHPSMREKLLETLRARRELEEAG